jgi:TRAP-type C4-dicarboxylate transport system permease small subunit
MALSKSKVCTVVSVIFLMVCIAFASLYNYPSTSFDRGLVTLINLCCLVCGGISLIFSTQIESKFFKAVVIVLNWICIYSWFLFSR